MSKLNVFISYSHKDEGFKDALDAHLTMLKRSDKIAAWNDRAILPGQEWDAEIKKQLEKADLILLLISAHFLASDYIWETEMTRAMERHERGEARIIPIFIKECDWHGAPFGKVQGLPKDAKPIGQADNDTAWKNVAQGIRSVVEEILTGSRASTDQQSIITPENGRNVPTDSPRWAWRRWAAGAAGSIALLASIAELSGYSLRDFLKTTEPMAIEETAAVTTTTVMVDTTATVSSPRRQQRPQTPAPTPALNLSVGLKTNISTAAQQTYREGENLHLYARATQPCYLRALYKLADGQVALLADDRQVKDSEAGQWIEIGYGFEVAAPFGEESLHLFAQSHPFDALPTREQDGYRIVISGLPEALTATRRGLKPKAQQAEAQLRIFTQAR